MRFITATLFLALVVKAFAQQPQPLTVDTPIDPRKLGAIEGTVTDSQKQPDGGIFVTLLPDPVKEDCFDHLRSVILSAITLTEK